MYDSQLGATSFWTYANVRATARASGKPVAVAVAEAKKADAIKAVAMNQANTATTNATNAITAANTAAANNSPNAQVLATAAVIAAQNAVAAQQAAGIAPPATLVQTAQMLPMAVAPSPGPVAAAVATPAPYVATPAPYVAPVTGGTVSTFDPFANAPPFTTGQSLTSSTSVDPLTQLIQPDTGAASAVDANGNPIPATSSSLASLVPWVLGGLALYALFK